MILLDTHVLLWSQYARQRLSRPAEAAIRRASRSGGIACAAFTLWELAWLGQRGRIEFDGSLPEAMDMLLEQVAVLPLSAGIALQAAQFGIDFPSDPGDRLIAATAVVHGLTLVTADQHIRSSGLVRTLW